MTPRALVTYAADLVFRLRWEIRPALASGTVVIAAPYIDTGVAIGHALGIDEQWLREVMRFAEPADVSVRARERKRERGWRTRPERGYGECCTAALRRTPARLGRRKARETAMASLAAGNGHVSPLTKKVLAALADGITGSPHAPAPGRARLRSARS